MKQARIYVKTRFAGVLTEWDRQHYDFTYAENYTGAPVSLTMPVQQHAYSFTKFPPFFEGLLPEGFMLDALLRKYKLDKHDYFEQLLLVGEDVVGAVTIERAK